MGSSVESAKYCAKRRSHRPRLPRRLPAGAPPQSRVRLARRPPDAPNWRPGNRPCSSKARAMANALLPLLTHPRNPDSGGALPHLHRPHEEPASRHAAWYPMCDYSPELAAIRAAAAVGCRAQFIDLSLPEVAAATDSGRIRRRRPYCASRSSRMERSYAPPASVRARATATTCGTTLFETRLPREGGGGFLRRRSSLLQKWSE